MPASIIAVNAPCETTAFEARRSILRHLRHAEFSDVTRRFKDDSERIIDKFRRVCRGMLRRHIGREAESPFHRQAAQKVASLEKQGFPLGIAVRHLEGV